MAVSIKDIASRANVTPTAVSMALKDRAGISRKKREEIKRLAEKMGYQPNPLSRGLKGGKTRTIGLLWWLGGPHHGAMVPDEIAIYAQRQHHYVSYIADHLMDPDVTLRSLRDFAQRKVEGAIVQFNKGINRKDVLDALGWFEAVVLVLPPTGSLRPMPYDMVYHDHVAGIIEAADYLIARGRCRPAVLVPADGVKLKAEPFLARFAARGLEVSDRSVTAFDPPRPDRVAEYFYQALVRNWPGEFPFDCLFCGTDEGGAMAMRFLREKGLRIPEDVAVVGFNGSEFAGCLVPPLASIDRHDDELARLAHDMLFRRLADPALPVQRETVRMTFIRRESAG